MPAIAHPNIALVKYWGKQPGTANIPATPSLSITLGALATRTHVEAAAQDRVFINGRATNDAKVLGLIAQMREVWHLPPIVVHSVNDFPTSAGLASSASGCAALVAAIDDAFGLCLARTELSIWARRGSASAARSVFGGFVTLQAEADWAATPLLGSAAWPLEVVVAITSDAAKRTPSTIGMESSRTTSPFFDAWTRTAAEDFDAAQRAVREKNHTALADVAEHSCLKMHALMLSTRPALLYWNEATVAGIGTVRRLREAGTPVFFTIDAGPQVKAVCVPGHSEKVAAALARTPGVLRTLTSPLGDGVRIVKDDGG